MYDYFEFLFQRGNHAALKTASIANVLLAWIFIFNKLTIKTKYQLNVIMNLIFEIVLSS